MTPSLRVKILGSGTSTGVPIIGCPCKVCSSENPKNKRTRASILVTNAKNQNLVIDTGPDFRMQLLREKVSHLGAVFYTHLHADHCAGLDDLRAFYFHNRKAVACFLAEEFIGELKQRFAYVFNDTGYLGTKPQVNLNLVPEGKVFVVNGLEVESFLVPHGDIRTSVYRIERFLYATDFKTFPPSLIQHWRGKIDCMVGSGVHFGEHLTHSVIPETVALARELQVKRLAITHLAHEVEYDEGSKQLPAFAELAYDGMSIDLD